MISNAAASSPANMSGAAWRFLRRQSSIVRIWLSASGVVRNARQAHRRRRNSSTIAGAGARRPSSADVHEADSVS